MKRASLIASLILSVSAGCSSGTSSYPDSGYYNNPPDAPTVTIPDGGAGGSDAMAKGGADAGAHADAGASADAAPGKAQTIYYFGDIKTNNQKVVATVVLPDKTTKVLTLSGISTNITTMALSPDGSKLAVAATDASASNGVLNVYDAASGGTPTTIASPAANATFQTRFPKVEFSPDGTLVAFTGDLDIDNSNELYVVPADGSAKPKKISPATSSSNNNVSTFAWAPDSKHVAFVGDLITDQLDGLWTVDATVGTPAPVQVVKQSEINTMQGVTDLLGFDSRSRLYFKSDFETNGVFRLYRAALDGTNRVRVPGTELTNTGGTAPASIGSFGLSPDGSEIAFSADSPTKNLFEVYVLDLSQSTANVVSSIPASALPAMSGPRGPSFTQPIVWSPDASKLAVSADWPLAMTDPSNAFSAFILPTSGTPGQVRVFNAVTADGRVGELGFTADGSFLVALGDLVTKNDNTLFATSDLATADQTATPLQSLPTGGDVSLFDVAP